MAWLIGRLGGADGCLDVGLHVLVAGGQGIVERLGGVLIAGGGREHLGRGVGEAPVTLAALARPAPWGRGRLGA